jgi:hypothetical protein
MSPLFDARILSRLMGVAYVAGLAVATGWMLLTQDASFFADAGR